MTMWRITSGFACKGAVSSCSPASPSPQAKGAKTRTWVTVKEQPIFAWGGLLAAKSPMGACLFWRGHRSVTMGIRCSWSYSSLRLIQGESHWRGLMSDECEHAIVRRRVIESGGIFCRLAGGLP